MLCINSGMLAENMEKSLFTQPWLMGKGLHKLGFFLDHKYVGNPMGMGSDRASQSLGIRHMFGFSHSGRKLGPIIVSKKLPFYPWVQNPTNTPNSSSVAKTGFNRNNTTVLAVRICWISALAPVHQHMLLCVYPKHLWCSFTSCQEWAFVFCVKKKIVIIKDRNNECTDPAFWDHLASFIRNLSILYHLQKTRVFGRLSARAKKVEVYAVGCERGKGKCT